MTYFPLRQNYVICLFHVVTFFNDVKITLCFGTSQLRMAITLQLRFVFVRHCDVFLLHPDYVIYLLDEVTLFYDVRITLYFGMFEACMEITLQFTITFRFCSSL